MRLDARPDPVGADQSRVIDRAFAHKGITAGIAGLFGDLLGFYFEVKIRHTMSSGPSTGPSQKGGEIYACAPRKRREHDARL